MVLGEAKDLRDDYGKTIEEIGIAIQQGQKQPVGCYVFVFWNDETITCAHKKEHGFSALAASGMLLKEAVKQAISSSEKEI